MSDVRQLLETRRAAIEAALAPLSEEYAQQRAKLVEIDLQIRKLQSEREEIDEFLRRSQPSQPRITIMEAILATLDHKPNGLTAQEILLELNEKYFNGRLVRTSLSPQLSRLKDRDGKIDLKGDRWFKLPSQPNLFGTLKGRL
ncbi:chromosome segregation ATPase [Bradyrhizobium japonicum]|jgi:chromosome segregation ATPase|uniref:Chromosome segregation ATPase n=1 Tax=Bradyrhizobium elkanii TaxID=29448 RepID=A0ABV4FGC8_BRAEL|nr:hypothetical protein [Bradyrhizobium elkanii]MBP2430609.1 chromosome segregation ATPase [Bradyrhizobium elkanii]MCP1736051.1 chromosome segregation ATPase [Bradyrhizobium elkanii]MCP1753849.1 chromosome segregation ATPase [Bradyrhizobium elkanii]MCP1979369.1 chromosome segregation ATPase [Bradyrhizobium elkanii]MCS3571392.1 chromosome segregation ATPase [Bradyrhizobium elkanii]